MIGFSDTQGLGWMRVAIFRLPGHRLIPHPISKAGGTPKSCYVFYRLSGLELNRQLGAHSQTALPPRHLPSGMLPKV
jgi:hypothetical protein